MKEFCASDVFDLICQHTAEHGRGMGFADIRDELGAEEDGMKVRNALRKLRDKGLIENDPITHLWSLTEDGLHTETFRQINAETNAYVPCTVEVPADLYGGYEE